MKVVLLHDWLTGFRGGERVLEVFCEMFPEAPLYTLLYDHGSTSKIIENRVIKTSFLNKIPHISKHYRKFLPLFPLAADLLKVTEQADLVLSSSHCVIKGVQIPSNAKHLCYIHSPMRYVYDQFENYFGPHAPLAQRMGAHFFRNYLQTWDKISNNNVDHFVANSHFVKQRINDYYHTDASVVHPFVDLADFDFLRTNPPAKEDYYLMVTAFAPNKRVDLAIEVFNRCQKKLKIIGSGQQLAYLKSIANNNIEFLGNCDRESVIDTMAKAKGFIFPGVEDFGITPLEAMCAGTPVIAFKAGGVLETLNDDIAQFFVEPTTDSLLEAINVFEKRTIPKSALIKRAEEFSKESFKRKILNEIDHLF